MKRGAQLGLVVWLIAATWTGATAQPNERPNHPELRWRTFETEHFHVYYHQGVERVAALAAEIAEDAYGPLTELYGYEPGDKIHLVINDADDYANGAAYFYDNKVEIWATALDFSFRGRHDWLRDVVTHELTHIIQLGAARKTTRHIPAAHLQYFAYQEEDRDDVLQGYANRIVSYAVPGTVIPGWFAEGVAQFQTDRVRHDHWDSHRDMILRIAVLNDGALSFDEMGVLNKTSLGNEMVYDHGFALVRYIAERHGTEALRAISRQARHWWRFDFSGAIKAVTGLSGEALHDRWLTHLRKHYTERTASVRAHPVEGELIDSDGFLTAYPAWSPSGDSLAYLSNKGSDYLSSAVFVWSAKDSSAKALASARIGPISWSADGGALYYAKRSPPNGHGSRFWDLYRYDLGKKREERLTFDARLHSPALSPDGRTLACIHNAGGTSNLALFDLGTGTWRAITDWDDFTQVYEPAWHPSGSPIAMSLGRGDAHDIATIRPDGSELRLIAATRGADRGPAWSPDGETLTFSSDRSGIYNLYTVPAGGGGPIRQVTNVLGGAFAPAVAPEGQRLAYVSYEASGYALRVLDLDATLKSTVAVKGKPTLLASADPTASTGTDATAFASSATEAPPSSYPTLPPSRPYRERFLGMSFQPRLAWDDGRAKLGTYLILSDVLEKQRFLSGALLAPSNLDLDIFGLYEFRRLRPTLYAEAIKVTRHLDEEEEIEDEFRRFQILGVDYDFNLLTVGAHHRFRGHRFELRGSYSRYSATVPQKELVQKVLLEPSFTYLQGFELGLEYLYRKLRRAVDGDINPVGRNVTVKLARQFNFFQEGLRHSGLIDEIYDKHFFNQYEVDWKEHRALPWCRDTLSLHLKLGWIDSPIDPFFNLYLGGIDQMRGYTYYSLEGRKAAMGSIAYRFPIARQIGKRFGHLHLDHLYGAVYFDMGRAWTSGDLDFKAEGFKRDVGGQFRMDIISFYSLPTKVQFDVAYRLDEVDQSELSRRVTDDGPLKAYFTVLFGYH